MWGWKDAKTHLELISINNGKSGDMNSWMPIYFNEGSMRTKVKQKNFVQLVLKNMLQFYFKFKVRCCSEF